MRPYVLAAALLAATAAPSSALLPTACRATAAAPSAQHSFGTEAAGSFGCDTARAALSVQVCLERLDGPKWVAVACENNAATGATTVSATAYGCDWGLFLYRTTARGTSSDGESGSAASLPVAYYCTPV